MGYAEASDAGRGVTPHIAQRLYSTAKTIIDAGIKNPSLFEVAVLFEEEFGAGVTKKFLEDSFPSSLPLDCPGIPFGRCFYENRLALSRLGLKSRQTRVR